MIEQHKVVRMCTPAVTVLLLASAAAAVRDASVTSDGNVWASAAGGAAYAKATAHDPHYDNKAIWSGLTGAERFVKQDWPGGRTLVWKHPGKSAGTRGAKTEAWDLANWVDTATGQAPEGLLGEATDIVLPPSETPYGVVFKKKGGGEHQPIHARHVTVDKGASWSSSGLYLHGNLWIKRGGRMSNHGAANFVGDKHTFFRNDNTGPLNVYAYKANPGTAMTQYFAFNKSGPDISVEVLGHSRAGDECRIQSGTLIVGVDSVLQPGRNAVPRVYKGATLALIDGARFGKWVNQIALCDMEMEGTLQGGLPERPLTRDALFGLSYHNTNGTDFYDRHTGEPTHEMKFHNMNKRVAAMIVGEGARIRSFTNDPSKATLLIDWFGLDAENWEIDSVMKRSEDQERKHRAATLAALPKRITVVFEPDTSVERVRFDHIPKGGLMLVDPASKSAWRNVLFGPHCEDMAETLFGRPENYNRRARTY